MGIFQQLCAMLDEGGSDGDIGKILDGVSSPSFRIQEVDFDATKFRTTRNTARDFVSAGLLLGGQIDGVEIADRYGDLVDSGIDCSDQVYKFLETRGIVGQYIPDLTVVGYDQLKKFDQMNGGERLRSLMERYDMRIPVISENFIELTEDPAVSYDFKKSGKHDRVGIVRYWVNGKDYPINYGNFKTFYCGVDSLVYAVNRYYKYDKYHYYPKCDWVEPLVYIIMYNYNVVIGDGGVYFIKKKFVGAIDLGIQRFFNHTSNIISLFDEALGSELFLKNLSLCTEDLYSLIYCCLFDSGVARNKFLEDAVNSLCKLYGAICIDVVKEFDLTRITLSNVYNFRMQKNYLLELYNAVREVIYSGKWNKILKSTVAVPIINTGCNDEFASIVIGYLLGIWNIESASRLHVSGMVGGNFFAHLDAIASKSGDSDFRKWYFSRDRTYFVTSSKFIGGAWKEAKKVEPTGIDGTTDPVIRIYVNTSRVFKFDDSEKEDLLDFLISRNNVRGLFLGCIGDEGLIHLVGCRSEYGDKGIGFAFKQGEKMVFASSRSIIYRNTLGLDISSMYSNITGLSFLDSFYSIVDAYRNGGGLNDAYSLGGLSDWSSQSDKASRSRGKSKKYRNKSYYY